MVCHSGSWPQMTTARIFSITDVSGLIRTHRRDELPVRLYDIATQLTAILTNTIAFHHRVMPIIGIVVEDPRDFPNQIRRRLSSVDRLKGTTKPATSTSVATSAGTHVTLGAAFGVCLAVAQQIASQHAPPCFLLCKRISALRLPPVPPGRTRRTITQLPSAEPHSAPGKRSW